METISDEEAIKLVKEIIAFMDTGIETGEDVEGFNGENFAYFKNKEDESILERYHRNYIKDVAYEYLTAMYKITGFRSGMGKAKNEFSGGYIRYRLDSTGEFSILSRENNEICIEAVFNKDNSLGDGMPDTDKGQIVLTLCDDNKWRISKISQWYDDLVFYELEEYIDEYNQKLPPLTHFILPGDDEVAAHFHVARTVVRRAERRIVSLTSQEPDLNPLIQKYVNRLSDLMFVLARYSEEVENKKWKSSNLNI